jgi:hypothetical protein
MTRAFAAGLDTRQCEGCATVFRRQPNVSRPEFAKRRFCSLPCVRLAKGNAPRAGPALPPAPLVLRACGSCRKEMPLRPGETPGQYRARDYCDVPCRRAAQNAIAWAKKAAARGERLRAQVAESVRTCPAAERQQSEADAIAAFIAEKGITPCPPAFAAPSPQGALDERAAGTVIARFRPIQEVGLKDVIRYVCNFTGHHAWSNSKDYRLDRRKCTRGDIYRIANECRAATGLPLYRLPNAMDMTA